MNITDVQVRLFHGDKVKADCRIVIDDVLAIHGIKVIQGPEKRYVSMPNRKIKDNYVDIVHPIKSELRNQIETEIFKEYDRQVAIKDAYDAEHKTTEAKDDETVEEQAVEEIAGQTEVQE